MIAGHLAAWAAGTMFGLGIALVIAMRESPPWYIEKWQLGAEGERKTEKVLKKLERSRWLVVHDVACARGNYDHIVVGPGGVFLLDTKNLQGIVHMRGEEPYLRRRSDPEADESCGWIRSGALAGAARLHDELTRRAGHAPWVKAVVVLWSEFDEDEGLHEDEKKKCVFVHGSRLHEWITSRPDTLEQVTTDNLATEIQAMAAEVRSAGPSSPQRL
jgi:Nuclease-related domain